MHESSEWESCIAQTVFGGCKLSLLPRCGPFSHLLQGTAQSGRVEVQGLRVETRFITGGGRGRSCDALCSWSVSPLPFNSREPLGLFKHAAKKH